MPTSTQPARRASTLASLLLLPLLARAESAVPLTPRVVPGTEAIELGERDAETACLLVHGFAGSRKDFGELGERLAQAGCLVMLDRLPGHGTTPEDMEVLEGDELIEHVRAGLKRARLEHERVMLVGFSMGGALSILAASLEPPDRLVLVSPFFEVTRQWYYLASPEDWNRWLSPLLRWIPKGSATVQVNRRAARADLYSYPRIPTRAVGMLAELGARAAQPELLASLDMPLLFLHSPGDFAASEEAAARAFDAIGSSDKRFVHLDERNNHHLFHDWDREIVLNEIVGFFEEMP
jgi:carboxylesterase